MKIIGVTGNIASGKSTVSKILATHLGVPLISVDEFSKNWIKTYELYVRSILKKYNIDTCGIDVFEILRKNLFKEQSLKNKLENIISDEFWKYVCNIQHAHEMVVIEYPLMFELAETSCFSYIIGVHCDRQIRIDRMKNRDYSKETIKERIDAQIPFQQNAKFCDLVIDTTNNPTPEYVIQQLQNSERFEALLSQGAIS